MDSLLTSPRLTALKQAMAADDTAALDTFWQHLEAHGTPLIEPIPEHPELFLVTFVWRAAGQGADHGRRGTLTGRDTTDPMEHLTGTDVWHKTYRVRNDMRESYQFAIEGEHVTDPLNPRRHVYPDDDEVGFKGWVSSILELPRALPQRWSRPRPGVPTGSVTFHQVHSQVLSRDYRIWIYTPPGYSPEAEPYGFVVFLDGRFYLDLFHAVTPLDNLLTDGLLPPLGAVFVSSVYDPTRQRDLACYPPFSQFLVLELLPWARANYHLAEDPARTAVVRCSLGGVMVAYLGLHDAEQFGNVLAQSAYFGWRSAAEPEDGWIIREYRDSPRLPLRSLIDVGHLDKVVGTWEPGFADFLTGARHMRDVLLAKGYEVHYHEFIGAHNPMNWPDTLPLGLMSLLGTPAARAQLARQRTGYAHPESLASTPWVAEHLDDPNVRVIEVVWGMRAIVISRKAVNLKCLSIRIVSRCLRTQGQLTKNR